MDLYLAARRIFELGHAPEFKTLGAEFLEWVLRDGGAELLTRYQEFHGLPVSGRLCSDTAAHLQAPRCGHPDVMGDTAESGWSLHSLSYYQSVAYQGVDPAEVAADYAEAVRRVIAVCGVVAFAAGDASTAQIVASAGPIDGPWNVLALSELPPSGAAAGVVLKQTFDLAETGLTNDQRIAMMAHEFCHCLGLGHAIPGSGNLMEPVLSSIGSPQAWDTAQLVARYGPPAISPPTATPPAVPIPPTPLATNGPRVDSVLLTIPAQGAYQYTFGFDEPGKYLVLILPTK